jgi:uncharacterized protein (DUF934 family)
LHRNKTKDNGFILASGIAIAICIRTNQNPNSVRRREAPPHPIWVLICPDTDGYSYKSRKDGLYIVAIAFPAFENVIKKYEEQV